MSNSISRETFQGMETDSKLGVLFDYSVAICEDIKTLKKRKKIDTVISGGMGFAGGFTAMLAKVVFWK
uniref:Uncharacterized protein n=1 Tax=viral metagenome TaxID=1070528 RepID=A0A6H1ZRE6_9ZZZZ